MKTSISLEEVLETIFRRILREELEAVRANANQQRHDAKRYLTIKEAAAFSSLAPSTIRLLIRKRKLRANSVGRRKIIKTDDLQKFLESDPVLISPKTPY